MGLLRKIESKLFLGGTVIKEFPLIENVRHRSGILAYDESHIAFLVRGRSGLHLAIRHSARGKLGSGTSYSRLPLNPEMLGKLQSVIEETLTSFEQGEFDE